MDWYFSDKEKEDFLVKNGYDIFIVPFDYSRETYSNYYETITGEIRQAIKAGKEIVPCSDLPNSSYLTHIKSVVGVDAVFAKVLKEKLLQL